MARGTGVASGATHKEAALSKDIFEGGGRLKRGERRRNAHDSPLSTTVGSNSRGELSGHLATADDGSSIVETHEETDAPSYPVIRILEARHWDAADCG